MSDPMSERTGRTRESGGVILEESIAGMEAAREMQIIPDRWMLESRRLVNWGSYEGYHEFRPSMDRDLPVTMLVGASESGKSTLVDAQISLLYPRGAQFNKASNSGRSERTDYTYLRGMIGVSDAGDGEGTMYLRGRDADGMPQPVWGAIVDTYRNVTTGQTLSCGKFMTLPAGGTGQDLRRTYVVWDKPIDPRAMDAHRGSSFTPTQFRDTYPGCAVLPNADVFHARIWGMMGLGEEACRMLHKIQSADAPSNLDGIFKQGVLGVPAALDKARETVGDYDGYAANFAIMEENARKLEKLEDIRDAHDAYGKARSRARMYDTVDASTTQGKANIRRWTLARMAATVSAQLPLDERERRERERDAAAARRQCADLDGRVDAIREQIAGIDGGSLKQLESELVHATRDLERTRDRQAGMGRQFADTGATMPGTQGEWEELREQAASDDQDYQPRLKELQEREYTAASDRKEAQQKLEQLRQDLERQRDHSTRITLQMDEDRALLCQATGLSPTDMPYVAELMDVRADQEDWRLAMNVVYGGLAATILVDRRHEQGFAAKVSRIDPRAMRRRNWRFIDTTAARDVRSAKDAAAGTGNAAGTDVRHGETADGGWLSGKLRYREDSPFAGWVREQTRAKGRDMRCVDAIDDGDETTRQVQRDGQTKDGRRGQHGTKGVNQVIGFVTEEYLAMLGRQVEEAKQRLADAEQAYGGAQEATERVRQTHALAQALAETPWSEVDVDGAAARVAGIQRDIEAIKSNPELARLTAMRDELMGELDRARGRAHDLESQAKAVGEAVEAACAWLDANAPAADGANAGAAFGTAAAAGAAADPTDSAGHAPASVDASAPAPFGDEVAAALGEAYGRQFADWTDGKTRAHLIIRRDPAGEAGASAVGGFADRAIAAIGRMMGEIREGLLAKATDERGQVERAMRDYKDAYARDDDALTCGVEDYRYYEEQLEEQSHLTVKAATADEYINCLHKLYMDLLVLQRTIKADEDTIREQLDRINQMLRGQTFGPRHGSLSLHANVRRPDPAFTAAMKRTIGMLADWERDPDRDPEQAPCLFAGCGKFIGTLRAELDQVRANSGGIKEYGARNLDPRGRSSFHATVHHADGEDERISSTGGRSGGALQELTSFVYGAALLYLLGGSSTTGEPSYTTLFLDEALIKADGRYTRRALSVLPRLGFQVIVSAPESKAGEIMQVSTKVYATHKDPGTGLTSLNEASVTDLREQWDE